MALRPSNRCRKRGKSDPEINIVPAMSLMIILIPFLLLTAVFGKASILNLYLPQDNQEQAEMNPEDKNKIIPAVALTSQRIILTVGKGNVKQIPPLDGQYNFKQLKEYLIEVKDQYPDSENLIILPKADVEYQQLISAMDTCREAKLENGDKRVLFPTISLGEYKDNGISPVQNKAS